jgi:hypothetical protein
MQFHSAIHSSEVPLLAPLLEDLIVLLLGAETAAVVAWQRTASAIAACLVETPAIARASERPRGSLFGRAACRFWFRNVYLRRWLHLRK